ncbi:MAG: 50S ribosomal protein L25/general stress protein Ctc [Burkholderiales bacterium]|nr:50S ribosomal protein L25/general stress protein Ctc [Burkholderiales bacterium]
MEVTARRRETQGTGASRRLRRADKVPGIVYGGSAAPVMIELEHNALYHQLRNEAFHASILTLDIDGAKEQVLLRAVNMHPWKQQVQHIDFQRVAADRKIHMKVPLHFVNEEVSPAVKLSGALVNHVLNEVDIQCLPADLPEFIEVDLKDLTVGHAIHVSELKMPKGVEPVVHRGEDPVVVNAVLPRAVSAEEEAAAEAAVPAAADVPAAKQAAKPEEAKPAEGKKPEKK